jgi:hypothetical protein
MTVFFSLLLPTSFLASMAGFLNARATGGSAETAAERGEGDTNFGSALVLWDQVFGTFRYPSADAEPARIALYAPITYPAGQTFVNQVFSMFRPSCCQA